MPQLSLKNGRNPNRWNYPFPGLPERLDAAVRRRGPGAAGASCIRRRRRSSSQVLNYRPSKSADCNDEIMERFLPEGSTLRSASTQDLEAIYDEAVNWANSQQNVVNSVNSAIKKATFARDELNRRAVEKSGRRVELLTWAIAGMTAVNVVLVYLVAFVVD